MRRIASIQAAVVLTVGLFLGETALGAAAAGPPIAALVVANTVVANVGIINPMAAATQAFDDAYAASGTAGTSVTGKVVGRFAPQVAAVAGSILALNGINRSVGLAANSIRQPCDSPGAGCIRRAIAPPPIAPPNPPIVPGVRPPR